MWVIGEPIPRSRVSAQEAALGHTVGQMRKGQDQIAWHGDIQEQERVLSEVLQVCPRIKGLCKGALGAIQEGARLRQRPD